MDVSEEGRFLIGRTSAERGLSRTLILSAERVMRRGRDLCKTVHERRRRQQYLNHLAKYAKVFPRMSRYLPLAGGDSDLLHIEAEERPEGLVVCVTGEVDLANVERFKAAIQPALSNCRNLILDASSLRYIDSTGLHVLMDAHQMLRPHNCQVFVAGASPAIAKVMHILHLDRLMPLVGSVDEALERIGNDSSSAASNG